MSVRVRTLLTTLSAALALGAGGPAPAQTTQTWVYVCDLGGAPARFVSQVTPVTDGVGGYNYQYQGQLTSQAARYVFTGYNNYADFVDLNTNERFRVQIVVQGDRMLLIANPQGPQPAQYLCRRAR